MINFEDVSFGYGKKTLFSGLNLRLEGGGVCGLLGKNGAGKTTLLSLMAGLLFPESGKCEVSGHVPRSREVKFLEQIYFVGEEMLSPGLKIEEYLSLYAPFYPGFDKGRFNKFLDEFKVGRGEKLKEMSHGTRKKFFLSFAFAVNSPVLMLDEPTNGLDIPSKSMFRKMVSEVIDENKIIIISTHQVRDLETIIDPVVILEDGKIIFNHTVAEIQERLLFSTGMSEPENALYAERMPGGWMAVSESNGAQNEEIKIIDIQLELLFNAVMRNQDKITKIFGKEAVN